MQRDSRPAPDAWAALTRAPVDDPIIAGGTGARPPASKAKCTITLDADLLGRARAAFLADGIGRGYASFSAWMGAAISRAVTESEARTGTLAPVQPGRLPAGRLPRVEESS